MNGLRLESRDRRATSLKTTSPWVWASTIMQQPNSMVNVHCVQIAQIETFSRVHLKTSLTSHIPARLKKYVRPIETVVCVTWSR